MKKAIKKELKSLLIFIIIGLILGLVYGLLTRFDIISPAENTPETNWWLIGGLIVGGLILVIVPTVILELAKKRNKQIAIEEKDERNLAIRGMATFQTFLFNIGLITAVILFCALTGHEPSLLILAGIGIANCVFAAAALAYYHKKM